MRRLVEPVKVETVKGVGNELEEVHTHPAFGQISISRTTGGNDALYGSDFDHHARITIRVAASQIRRRTGRDWYNASHRGDILELDMSEAQFATLITSASMGDGTPCTLRYIDGRMIPDLPKAPPPTERFGIDMLRIVQEPLDRLQGLEAMIDGMNLPKTKAAALKHEARVAHDLLKANTPYIAERFGEHMEETVEKAKVEVQGFMAGMASAAGMHALANQQAPIALIGGGDDE